MNNCNYFEKWQLESSLSGVVQRCELSIKYITNSRKKNYLIKILSIRVNDEYIFIIMNYCYRNITIIIILLSRV